jgi:hypothetical protein
VPGTKRIEPVMLTRKCNGTTAFAFSLCLPTPLKGAAALRPSGGGGGGGGGSGGGGDDDRWGGTGIVDGERSEEEAALVVRPALAAWSTEALLVLFKLTEARKGFNALGAAPLSPWTPPLSPFSPFSPFSPGASFVPAA